ncbi:hypothetical protein CBM2633_P90053 [Cupriavidus taiwanensis]|uniref:Uncharacterized protein n=2 Tax=Cupriavidus TaxID=106589 RepID=A0A375JAR8_9BURK|nr:hypothetical protein CBM2588_P100056 [Cupriavidus taiwanensis]SOZ40867.1 hypothetical protein CBM2605_P90053 [Cupriavidus neocaledonicus]SOY74169.1 hypothetical protein CBM2592_P120052 [Cupriavidus taiwanensis]SOY77170.1 hypothetical protein CBM2585_P90054 [Cupriavidus taiwanensis]SOY77431.1 hypothetical protein CBM2589_P90054 [Cupriavidus taiwanensis]
MRCEVKLSNAGEFDGDFVATRLSFGLSFEHLQRPRRIDLAASWWQIPGNHDLKEDVRTPSVQAGN